MERHPTPTLLPILRSQQQGEILNLVLSEPESEFGLSDITRRTGVPYTSVHREVERAVSAGLITSRRIGNTRFVRANTASPYFAGLSDILQKAFGPPIVLGRLLSPVADISRALIYGSWAARFSGEDGPRPVADIDLLILGAPDRAEVYAAATEAERLLGRPVQVTIRPDGWIDEGSGQFHATVVGRPIVEVALSP